MDLMQLGRAAAEEVVGKGNVERVEVAPGEDALERPAYQFSFIIDLVRADQRPGLILSRLVQKLRDKLVEQHDERTPIVRITSLERVAQRPHA